MLEKLGEISIFLRKMLYFFPKLCYHKYIEKERWEKMSEDPYEKSKLKMYKNIYKKGDEVGASFVFLLY